MVTYFLNVDNNQPSKLLAKQSSICSTDKNVAVSSNADIKSLGKSRSKGSFDFEKFERRAGSFIRKKSLALKRKSLCRQHHIFSSSSNLATTPAAMENSTEKMPLKSNADSDDGSTKIETPDTPSAVAAAAITTINNPPSDEHQTVSPIRNQLTSSDTLPKTHKTIIENRKVKSMWKTNLVESIDSLEKFLKNDISLSDFNGHIPNGTKCASNHQPLDDFIISSDDVNCKLLPESEPDQIEVNLVNKQLNIDTYQMIVNDNNQNTTEKIILLNEKQMKCDHRSKINDISMSSSLQQHRHSVIGAKGIGMQIKESIATNSKQALKMSQSLHIITNHRSKCKVPISKSLNML